MSSIAPAVHRIPADAQWLEKTVRAAGPALLFGLRLWASVSLALYVAFWLQLDNPFWAGASAAIVCQPQLGASLRKGWFRMIGTLIGAGMSVLLTACFAQDRVLFLGALGLWCAVCAFAATLLRNFASYAAALSGYTVAIIAVDLLGATGGVDANAAFLLAVTRASEICLGIACGGVVLAMTDFGGARHRLAAAVAELAAQITAGFVRSLVAGASGPPVAQRGEQDLIGRVIALDPMIDRALGESSQIRYYSPVLQRAVDGLFAALAGWRAVTGHLARLAVDESQEAVAVAEKVPPELRLAPDAPARWLANPVALRQACETVAHQLTALPVGTPSRRLLADQAADVFTGLSDVFDGLALLVGDPARPLSGRGIRHLRVPDWLPAFIGAGRAFVTIGAVAAFWIVTGWPGGSGAMTFAAIVGLLLAPRAEQAYAIAMILIVAVFIDVVIAAIVAFAVLPALGTETFATLSFVLGCYLVPMSALLAQARQPWQVALLTATTLVFLPLLQPTNPMKFDVGLFYNTALTVIAGVSSAAVAFRLLPPLSPALRARRLLTLTLRDLRGLARGRRQGDWEGRVNGRISVLPGAAMHTEQARLMAARSAGGEMIRLRCIARQLAFGADLDASLASVARADSATATANLARLDAALAARGDAGPEAQLILRARGSISALSEALTEYAAYFDERAPA